MLVMVLGKFLLNHIYHNLVKISLLDISLASDTYLFHSDHVYWRSRQESIRISDQLKLSKDD